MSDNMGASQANGLVGPEGLESDSRLHPTGDIPSAGPYPSQEAAWNDALEKAAQIVERYNRAFPDPECGGAPDDIRALKRGEA